MQVLVPLGTRPEIVKLSPIVAALEARGAAVRVVATGQHHDPTLTDVFYDRLGLHPDERWKAEGDDGTRVGAILTHAYVELQARRPDLVLVLGDTYTVPLFCVAARRHRVPVAHVEAGLRSFNPTSMEEVNRKIAAATASLHFAPTELAARFLAAEGVPWERIHVVGNPVIDVLRKLGVVATPVSRRSGVVVTVHRPTNVDDPARLRLLVELVRRACDEIGPVTFPLHPRTRARLEEQGLLGELRRGGIDLRPPLPYDRMLELLARSRVVLTDSGGLQEEAAWLGVPVVVLRQSTPRWEGVAAGLSVLTGVDVALAIETARRLAATGELTRLASTPCPYGDGHTADRVADIIVDARTEPLLRLDEPDFVGQTPPA
jgi:UDP-N-acetylglucosamine 2-epimerase (non-hydrolysing)